MTAPLQITSCGGENDVDDDLVDAEECIDFAELLRVALKQQNLMYIADIIMEVDHFSIEQLMSWSRDDLTELLSDIHKDGENEYSIKVAHRNRFADLVTNIAARKHRVIKRKKSFETLLSPITQHERSPSFSNSSQIKLLFLGKEEEDAIELIQGSQQFMDLKLDDIKRLYRELNQNKENVEQSLQKICDQLKERIDLKQQQLMKLIDNIYQYHLNLLNERNDETQESAKIAAKFYNDYHGWFTDQTLTKSERKIRLNDAKSGVEDEMDKMKKYRDKQYKLDVVLNEHLMNDFFDECLNLREIGFELPAIDGIEVIGNEIKWNKFDKNKLNDEVKNLFYDNDDNKNDDDDDDNKEEHDLPIHYHVMYRLKASKNRRSKNSNKNNKNNKNNDHNDDDKKEKKMDDWNLIKLDDVTKCDISNYVQPLCKYEAKIEYVINNQLVSSPSRMISGRNLHYIAKWASECRGDGISLSDNNKKAIMLSGYDQSVRAQYPIQRGCIVKLNYTFFCPSYIWREIVGVISSEFNSEWKTVQTPYNDIKLTKYCFGLKCRNSNTQYYGGRKDMGWTAGKIPTGKEITIQMIIDWRTSNQCRLSFYINGKFQGPSNQNYSMKLPPLKDKYVWYPLTCFNYKNNWCKIECVE